MAEEIGEDEPRGWRTGLPVGSAPRPAGQPTKVTEPDSKTTTYQWDLAGQRYKMTSPGGSLYQYRLDAGHRLQGVDIAAWGAWWPQVNYTRNNNGQTTREDLAGGSGAGYRQWAIDPATGLLNRYSQTVGSLTTNTSTAFDSNGRVANDCEITSTTAGAPCAPTDRSTTYTYD